MNQIDPREHIPIVKKITSQFEKKHKLASGSLLGEGWLGLLIAIKKFNPKKGVLFEYFASSCIWMQCRGWLKKEAMIRQYNKKLSNDLLHNKSTHDSSPSNDYPWWWNDLSPKEQERVFLIAHNLTHSEAAAALGVSSTAVSNQIRKIAKSIGPSIGLKRVRTCEHRKKLSDTYGAIRARARKNGSYVPRSMRFNHKNDNKNNKM